jgi:hypothetical protein
MLHPDMASPQAITEWLERSRATGETATGPDFDGLSVVPKLLRELTQVGANATQQGEQVHAAD